MASKESNQISAMMQGVHERITAASVSETLARQQREEAGERMRNVQEMLRSGESTGDPIRDLVIVRYGLEYPKYEQRYRNLQQEVENHPGEFAMVVSRNTEPLVYDDPNYRAISTNRFALGIINDPNLIIDATTEPDNFFGFYSQTNGKVEISTGVFLLQYGNSLNKSTIDGNIVVNLHHLNEELEVDDLDLDRNGQKPKKLEVFVGDKSVIKGLNQLQGSVNSNGQEAPRLMVEMAYLLEKNDINGQPLSIF